MMKEQLQAETAIFMIFVQRQAFAVDAINQIFDARFPDHKNNPPKVSKVQSFFEEKFPNHKSFIYRAIVGGDDLCPD